MRTVRVRGTVSAVFAQSTNAREYGIGGKPHKGECEYQAQGIRADKILRDTNDESVRTMLMIIAEAKMRNPVVTNTPIVPLLPALPFPFIGSFVPFFPLTTLAIRKQSLSTVVEYGKSLGECSHCLTSGTAPPDFRGRMAGLR